MQFYERRGCVAFWNPRDITIENLRTDTPDAEALLIEPGSIASCETTEGQYLVKQGELQPYESYPGHEGVDKVFRVLQRTRPGFFATAAIKQCVKMRWVIMDSCERTERIFFKRYEPPAD